MNLNLLSRSERDLHERALQAAHLFAHAERSLLATIDEVDHSSFFRKLGFPSCYAYCREALKLSENVAGVLINIVRKSKKVPELKARVLEGKITISNAGRISSIITPENKHEWLKKAEELPKAKLEKEIAKVYPRAAVRERVSHISEKRLKLEMGVEEEVMALFRRAQDIQSSREKKAVSLEETLKAALETYLEKHDPLEKAKRQKKTEEKKTEEKETDDIPAHILHAVHRRDQAQCRGENPDGSRCPQRRWLEVHHVKARKDGGPHTLENLLTLCGFHHRQVHTLPGQGKKGVPMH